MSLEQQCREPGHLRLHFRTRQVDRGSAHRLRPAAERADALLDDARVAMVDRHVIHRDAELIGQHLGERRLVPLPVRRRAGRGAEAAVAFYRDLRILPAARPDRAGRTQAAHLDVHREAQADDPPLGACGVPCRLKLFPAGRFQSAVERPGVIARVVQGAGLGPERELIRRNEVPAAQLGGVHAELARQHVHRPLDVVDPLRPSGAPIGIGRRLVREDLGQLGTDRREGVDAACHRHRQRRDAGGQQHVVRADIGNDAHLQGEHTPIPRRGKINVGDRAAAVDRRQERLGAILDPLDRQAEPFRQRGGDEFLAVDVDLGAEAAPNLRRDGADAVLPEANHLGDERSENVRGLRRRPDGHRLPARLVPGDDRRAVRWMTAPGGGSPSAARWWRPHWRTPARSRCRPLHPLADAGPDRHRSDADVVRKVRMQHRRLAGHRLFRIDHRRERLVIDGDRVGRIARDVAVGGDHHRNRLADVADHVHRNRPVLRRRKRRRHPHRRQELGDLIAPVKTASTPSIAAAALTSMERIRPCGMSLRLKARCCRPAIFTSST